MTIRDINFLLTPTVSVLELLWLVLNAVGVAYSLRNWHDAEASLGAAVAPPVDVVGVIVARMGRFIQANLLVTQLVFLALGVLAVLTPNRTDMPAQFSSTLITLGLVAVAAQLAYKSRRVHLYRRQALKALKREYDANLS